MTTESDEIRNLRASLEHIRQWCDHEVKYGAKGVHMAVCETVKRLALLGLKTPRASKGIMMPIVAMPPAPGPEADHAWINRDENGEGANYGTTGVWHWAERSKCDPSWFDDQGRYIVDNPFSP